MKLMFGLKPSDEICPKHNTPKFVIGGHICCPKCGNEYRAEEERRAKLQAQQQRIDRLMASMNLPKRHSHCSFDNFQAEKGSEKYNAKAKAYRHAKSLLDGGHGNLILCGSTGTGKTHLGCAMGRMFAEHGIVAKYTTTYDFIEYIMSGWSDKAKRDGRSQKHEIEDMARTDVLILDEYGLHDQKDFQLQIIHELLYKRYDEMKPTILISNFNPSDLRQNLGDRLWSRFQHDGLTEIVCKWNDERVSA